MAQLFDGQVRFGIHAAPQHVGYGDYRDLWLEAERLGYDWASVFDHFIPIGGLDPEGPCLEGLTLLAGLAAQTSRIRCGILVVGNTYRHPAVLANMAATIDLISGGRLELGIGAGWWELEHEQYGIPYPPVGRRIRMLGEAAPIIKSLLADERTTFEGRYYRVTDALCEPKPVQAPLPLWVGGGGEKLTLKVVAESADGWNTFLMPMSDYQRKLDALAEHCRAAGRDPRDIRKSLVVQALVGETEAEVEERAEQIARSRNLTREALLRQAIVGTPEQAAEQLRPYVAAGVGDFILGARPPYDYAGLELFINQVAPLVRAMAA